MVLNFPHDATWLSEQDRQLVMQRVKEDQRSSAGQVQKLKGAFIWQALTDWKTWPGMAI
jgi:hypothetical protein